MLVTKRGRGGIASIHIYINGTITYVKLQNMSTLKTVLDTKGGPIRTVIVLLDVENIGGLDEFEENKRRGCAGEFEMSFYGKLIYANYDETSNMVRIEGREDFIEPTAKHTLIKMMKLYVSLTFIGAALLSFAGMDIFTASNISMTALATGGFSTRTARPPFQWDRLEE